jgi:hypothetical protein
MVDALCEAQRVLVPEGICIDIRPVTAPVRIEAVTAVRTAKAIEVDSYGAAEDDAAADAAVQQALSSKWFVFEQRCDFDFEVYCDSGADLRAYAETGRRMREARIPYDDLNSQRNELAAITGLPSRLRCHRPSMLSVYSKPAASR